MLYESVPNADKGEGVKKSEVCVDIINGFLLSCSLVLSPSAAKGLSSSPLRF